MRPLGPKGDPGRNGPGSFAGRVGSRGDGDPARHFRERLTRDRDPGSSAPPLTPGIWRGLGEYHTPRDAMPRKLTGKRTPRRAPMGTLLVRCPATGKDI